MRRHTAFALVTAALLALAACGGASGESGPEQAASAPLQPAAGRANVFQGAFTPFMAGATAITYDPKLVPGGSTARVSIAGIADTTVVNLLAGVFAAISDLYSVVLPCGMTYHFDLPTRQKVALNLIFCMGLLVVASSGVRTYFLYREISSYIRGKDIQSLTFGQMQRLVSVPTSPGQSSTRTSAPSWSCSSPSSAPVCPRSESSCDATSRSPSRARISAGQCKASVRTPRVRRLLSTIATVRP